MSMLEKYRIYQNGIVTNETNELTQEFFKTLPTEKQLILLDKITKTHNLYWILIVLFYTFLGVLIGFALCDTYYKFDILKKLLGV